MGNCKVCKHCKYDDYIRELVCQKIKYGGDGTYVHEMHASEACLVVEPDFGCVKFELFIEGK